MSTKFNVEIPAEQLPRCWFHFAETLLSDPKSTAKERQLASLLLELGSKFNGLIQSFEYGTVTVKVDDARIQ